MVTALSSTIPSSTRRRNTLINQPWQFCVTAARFTARGVGSVRAMLSNFNKLGVAEVCVKDFVPGKGLIGQDVDIRIVFEVHILCVAISLLELAPNAVVVT